MDLPWLFFCELIIPEKENIDHDDYHYKIYM